MRTVHLFLLALAFTQACRTSRATIEVMDNQAPPRPPGDDYPNVERSIETTFAVSAISLPTVKRDYDHLDLVLKAPGAASEAYRQKNYKPGEPFSIEAHRNYEIILSAYAADMELYSTRFCSQRQTFRAEEGANTFTASLCAKPNIP